MLSISVNRRFITAFKLNNKNHQPWSHSLIINFIHFRLLIDFVKVCGPVLFFFKSQTTF
jgi:hypothetical protein